MKIAAPQAGLNNINANAEAVQKTPLTPEEAARKKFKIEQAEQVARDFETMFMDLILKTMRETAKPEDASNAHEIYQGMLDGEYAKSMTGAQDFGIRSMVLDWMKNNDPELSKINKEGLKALQEIDKTKNSMKFAADQYRMQMSGGK